MALESFYSQWNCKAYKYYYFIINVCLYSPSITWTFLLISNAQNLDMYFSHLFASLQLLPRCEKYSFVQNYASFWAMNYFPICNTFPSLVPAVKAFTVRTHHATHTRCQTISLPIQLPGKSSTLLFSSQICHFVEQTPKRIFTHH